MNNIFSEVYTRVQDDKKLKLDNVNPILSRYMPLETLCICLKNNSLQFSKPKTWKKNYDVFEDLLSSVCYMHTNYSDDKIPHRADPLTENYYAQCWNVGTECEGMWKSHTGGLDNGVMIRFKLENIIKLITTSFSEEVTNSDNIQFVKVEYRKVEYIVDSLNEYLYDVFVKGKNADRYIDFFKLKREDYSYEKEYRFLIKFDKNTDKNTEYKYTSSFIDCIEEIIFSPKFSDIYYRFCKNELINKHNISKGKISKSKLHDLDYYLEETNLSIINKIN